MSTVTPPSVRTHNGRTTEAAAAPEEKGLGWVLFAGIMVVLAGVLNVVYGIAAVSSSKFFVANAQFILSDLNTWGWVTIGIGALQLLVAFSIWRGGRFGQWLGIGIAGLSAIAALLSVPAYPLWSLSILAIDILVIYGLAVYGGRPYRI